MASHHQFILFTEIIDDVTFPKDCKGNQQFCFDPIKNDFD